MKTQRYRKLNVWRRSMEFVSYIYKITQLFPKHELYGLTSQLRRAAISISLNIAEGSAAQTDIEFKRFLGISLKSSYEVSCGIEIAYRLKYIDDRQSKNVENECAEITAMIRGFINKLAYS